MCRWLAYSGPAIPISRLLFEPENALVRQSIAARKSATPTNGDGFGLAWYGAGPTPGLFRDTMPAWNDANLRSLAEHVASPLFLAHVRASTGTATTRANCHPFRWERWSFMHNGQIGGWRQVKRRLEAHLPEELYLAREGSTDSELFFLLWVANGIERDPFGALAETFGQVCAAMRAAAVDEPLRMTAAASDGARLIALRRSSDNQSPSLYHATGAEVAVAGGSVDLAPGAGCAIVLSEPLDAVPAHWTPVAEGDLVVVAADGAVTARPL